MAYFFLLFNSCSIPFCRSFRASCATSSFEKLSLICSSVLVFMLVPVPVSCSHLISKILCRASWLLTRSFYERILLVFDEIFSRWISNLRILWALCNSNHSCTENGFSFILLSFPPLFFLIQVFLFVYLFQEKKVENTCMQRIFYLVDLKYKIV